MPEFPSADKSRYLLTVSLSSERQVEKVGAAFHGHGLTAVGNFRAHNHRAFHVLYEELC